MSTKLFIDRIVRPHHNPVPRLCALIFFSVLFSSLTAAQLHGENSNTGVDVRIIVVDSPAKADSVLTRLKKGEDFSVVAREV